MTENEAKNKLDSLHYAILNCSFNQVVSESEMEALCMAKDVLEEIQQYRAIGTIEEFKAIKQWKSDVIEDFCRYDASSFEEIVANARAKAIDEFAEKLSTDVESFVAELNGIRADLLTLDYFSEFVFEIAEQLKAGGKNERDFI